MEAEAPTRKLNGGRREDARRRPQTRGDNSRTWAGTASPGEPEGQSAKRGLEAHVRANLPPVVVVATVVRDDGEPLGHARLHVRPRVWVWPVTTGAASGGVRGGARAATRWSHICHRDRGAAAGASTA